VNRGFTLIELMVVLVLVAVFTLIGIPSYRSITTTNRMATEMNAFVGDLQFARSEAIKRGYDVSMCPANPAVSPPTPTAPNCLAANTTRWTNGWVVYAPPFGGNATSVLRIQAAMQGGDSLVSNAAAGAAVTFNRNGFTTNGQTVALDNQGQSNVESPCAVISTVGRVRAGKIQKSQPIQASNCKQ
ncbi:MAG: GspH/FimT family protein, partial [Acidihalobacter sp.]|uniref:GspH/FimT family pseudopilin n=1 Tax=Acidihalobacter sp. TaxID=1872108 RepID=UPI00307F0001